MKIIYIFIIILLILIIYPKESIDDNINKEFQEFGFKKLSKIKKNPLKIKNKKVYYLKTPNNLIYYKNILNKNIIFLDDYHTFCFEKEIKCEYKNFTNLVDFLKLFYSIEKKINLFIEVIHPSEYYNKYTNILIENTVGFNSNNTITTIIDENKLKKCFYKAKECKNFKIHSTDIRVSNDMLINYYNIYIKEFLNEKEIDDIISLTLNTPKNLYYVIFNYLKNKNKKPKKIKKYIFKNIKNEIYIYYHKLNKKYQKQIIDFIENIYKPKLSSYNFLNEYILMFMDLLTILKILCVPKNEIVILYQGLYHNFYIRKFFDLYLKYDYKKRAENEFKHKNKCINLSNMDEIIS